MEADASLHDRIVSAYADVFNLQTKRFNKFLSKVWSEPLPFTIVPDAYKYCQFCKVLHVYEVENHNRIEKKLDKYIDLWYYADCE